MLVTGSSSSFLRSSSSLIFGMILQRANAEFSANCVGGAEKDDYLRNFRYHSAHDWLFLVAV